MSITNSRRVKDAVVAFRDGPQPPSPLCPDPPIMYTKENLRALKEYRQYGKGALKAIAEAVEERAGIVLTQARQHAGDNALVNDAVVAKLHLYSYESSGSE